MPKDITSKLVYARQNPLFGKLAYYLLKSLGVEIPLSVQIGENVELAHGGVGIVIHPNTTIGKNVKIYPGVTIGRADIQKSIDSSKFAGVEVKDNVILSAGAKVLGKDGILIIEEYSIVGANAVLLESTAEGEIWAGVPAVCIGHR